jgi:hypothetical protein
MGGLHALRRYDVMLFGLSEKRVKNFANFYFICLRNGTSSVILFILHNFCLTTRLHDFLERGTEERKWERLEAMLDSFFLLKQICFLFRHPLRSSES